MDSFSEHGKTYKIEKAPALWRSASFAPYLGERKLRDYQHHGGLHVDPGTSEEPVWADPDRGTTTCDAIRLRISAKCYEFHDQLSLPRGKLLKETPKSGVTLLVSVDDLLTFEVGSLHLWYNYTDRSKDQQILWRKAGFLLYGRANRIAAAWIDHIKNSDSSFYPPFDYATEKAEAVKKYPKETRTLSLQHMTDSQTGVQTRIIITEYMAMFLHEIGVTPEIPHPDAPEWDYGTFEVTPTTLDDLEQRSVRIIQPTFLESWKEIRKRGGLVPMESGRQYGWAGIMTNQVSAVGRGLANRITKARATLEEKAQKVGQ